MASSGAFETSVYSGVGDWPNRIRIEWSSTQNISSNTSTIHWKVKPMGGSGRRWCQFYNITIILGGVTIANKRNLWGRADGQWSTTQYNSDGSGGTKTSFSGSFTLTHDANGKRTLTGSAKCAIAGSVINSSLSGYSVALPTIARASSFSVSGNTMGSPITIKISSASSSFTHTLTWKFGDKTGTIDKPKTSKSSIEWKPPISLASQIPDATSGSGTISCTTYNGKTKIGQKSMSLTLKVPSNIVPSISSFVASIASTKPANCGLYVKNHSTVRWNVSASGAYDSTIKKCVISGQNLSYTSTKSSTSYSATSSTLTIAGEKTYKVTVTDSRGRTASTTGRITIEDYNPPAITSISSFRSDEKGNLNGSGEYITHQLTSSFYTLNRNNKIKIEVFRKESSEPTYSNSVIIKDDSNKTVSYTYTYPTDVSFSVNSTYDFKIVISDSVGKSATVYTHVGTKNVPLNISSNNNSVAIGGLAKTFSGNNGRFDCAWEAHFATAPITDSDRNLKHNIKDINVDVVDKLRPVQYNLINDDSDTTHYGFIAQDVEQAFLESGVSDKIGIVHYDENCKTQERINYALSYDEIIPLLVKKCQELQREIDRLKGE